MTSVMLYFRGELPRLNSEKLNQKEAVRNGIMFNAEHFPALGSKIVTLRCAYLVSFAESFTTSTKKWVS